MEQRAHFSEVKWINKFAFYRINYSACDMVIFPVWIFGRNDFHLGWLETLINRDFKIIDDFLISQKYNPKLPQNNSVSFLGSVFGKRSWMFLTQEGCKYEEEKFQGTV